MDIFKCSYLSYCGTKKNNLHVSNTVGTWLFFVVSRKNSLSVMTEKKMVWFSISSIYFIFFSDPFCRAVIIDLSVCRFHDFLSWHYVNYFSPPITGSYEITSVATLSWGNRFPLTEDCTLDALFSFFCLIVCFLPSHRSTIMPGDRSTYNSNLYHVLIKVHFKNGKWIIIQV